MAKHPRNAEKLGRLRTVASALAAFAATGLVLSSRQHAPDWVSATLIYTGALSVGTAFVLSVLEWQAARQPERDEVAPRAKRRSRLALASALGLVGIAGAAVWYHASVSGTPSRDAAVPADTTVGIGPYRVTGTCGNHTCLLYERSGPSLTSVKVASLVEGQRVTIACQIEGGRFRASSTQSSDIWDRLEKLGSGPFVTDYFIDTPGVGRFTKGLARCRTAGITGRQPRPAQPSSSLSVVPEAP